MKKLVLVFLGLMVVGIIFSVKPVMTNSSSAPLGRTGAPGETSCASCHSGSALSGEIQFEFISQNEGFFTEEEACTVKVTANYPASMFGFSMTALNDQNQAFGNFAVINTQTTSQGSTSNGRKYVGHKGADSNKSWEVVWTAPANSGNSEVRFYYIVNAADGNGGTGGDYIVTGNKSFSLFVDTQVEDQIAEPWVHIKQTYDDIVVAFSKPSGESQILKIFDLSGRELYVQSLSGLEKQIRIHMSQKNKGIYVLTLMNGSEVKAEKFYLR